MLRLLFNTSASSVDLHNVTADIGLASALHNNILSFMMVMLQVKGKEEEEEEGRKDEEKVAEEQIQSQQKASVGISS